MELKVTNSKVMEKSILPTIIFLLFSILQEVNCQRRLCPSSSSPFTPSSSFIPSSSLGPSNSSSSQKLQLLRKKLLESQLNGYLIPVTDEHLSEVVSDAENRLKFMTGFDGTNGLGLILDSVNGSINVFFTDSRYGEAADEQLDCNWIIHVSPDLLTSAIKFIKVHADPGSKIGADVRLFSLRDWLRLNEILQSCGHSMIPQSYNLIDEVWNDMKLRPVPGAGKERQLFIHQISYAGRSWQEKVSDVMTAIESRNGHALIVSSLEEIAWLLNLRGSDIHYTPVFKSYAVIVSRAIVWFFVDEAKVTREVRDHLNTASCSRIPGGSQNPSSSLNQEPCVVIKDYKDFLWTSSELINAVTDYHNTSSIRILIPDSINYYVYGMIPEQFKVSISESPIAVIKAVKNEIEVGGMKSAHVKDAVALIDFMARLSAAVIGRSAGSRSSGQTLVPEESDLENLDELSVTRLLSRLRREQRLNRGDSFEAISAVDGNAAKAHYSPRNTSSRPIEIDSIYLIDSGGQYLDGTTDVTRVMVFNDKEYGSDAQVSRRVEGLKEVYTRILMGLIDLSSFIFPSDIKSRDLDDLLARRHLYQVGLSYGHGTSHGIGSYLMVHENSIYIGSKAGLNIPLKEGMFMSIEPGFYEPGNVRIWTPGHGQGSSGQYPLKTGGFGMRLENIVEVVEARIPQLVLDTNHGPINGRKKWLTFEPITLVPFEKRLINYDLLELTHKKWLNRYNSKIRLVVGREVKNQNRSLALDWMMDQTEPIPEIHTDTPTDCFQRSSASSTLSTPNGLFRTGPKSGLVSTGLKSALIFLCDLPLVSVFVFLSHSFRVF